MSDTLSGVEPVRELCPPREGKIFKDKELGQGYLECVARHQGYAIAIKSDKGPGHQSRYFYCTRGHQNTKRAVTAEKISVSVQAHKISDTSSSKNDSKKTRKSSTAKSGCTFGVSLNYWSKQGHWKVKVQHARHNHKPFRRPNDLPRLRRFLQPEEELLQTMTEANVPPRTIRTMLPGESAHRPMQDIYNQIARSRKIELDGKTPMVHLITRLRRENWFYCMNLGPSGTVKSLFFAHPEAIQMGRRFPYCFGIDCTYNTNKHRLPLLHIVGSTCFNSSFTLAFCFLNKEDHEEYTWSLKQLDTLLKPHINWPKTFVTDKEQALIGAISDVFPGSIHILCMWHINKAILTKCQTIITVKKEWEEFYTCWHTFVASRTEEGFHANKNKLVKISQRHSPKILQYLESHWFPIVEKYVKLFANDFLHFGNQTTSRVEGSHHFIKSFLENST